MSLAAATALCAWFGLVSAISPCPLATHTLALGVLARNAPARTVLARAILYSIGRATAYTILAALIVRGIVAAPHLANLLQRELPRLIGPLCILAAVFQLGLLPLPDRLGGHLVGRIEPLAALPWGAFALGILLALAFCPFSAACYFGALIPLAAEHASAFLLPAAFGIASALPVALLAPAAARGLERMAQSAGRLAAWGKRLRHATAWGLLGLGVVLVMRNLMGP